MPLSLLLANLSLSLTSLSVTSLSYSASSLGLLAECGSTAHQRHPSNKGSYYEQYYDAGDMLHLLSPPLLCVQGKINFCLVYAARRATAAKQSMLVANTA